VALLARPHLQSDDVGAPVVVELPDSGVVVAGRGEEDEDGVVTSIVEEEEDVEGVVGAPSQEAVHNAPEAWIRLFDTNLTLKTAEVETSGAFSLQYILLFLPSKINILSPLLHDSALL